MISTTVRVPTPRGIANILRYTTPNVPVRERVKDLQVSTLLVCGERETRFMRNRAFAEHTIPGLRVVGANAGHAVNIEAAETFNTAVVDFLRRHLSGTVGCRADGKAWSADTHEKGNR
jgi:pimeloyl-ACP methyl ester carboxylesterase